MAERTEIAWCDSTFNPWIGCTKVSPGCDNCYAARQDTFRRWTPEGWGGPRRRTAKDTWAKVEKWNETPFYECSACGWRGDIKAASAQSMGSFAVITCPNNCDGVLRLARRRVFCSSLADVFDNQVPIEWRQDLFRLILDTPHLDWLLLTKRIGNVPKVLDDAQWEHLGNVWLGATVVNQEEADRDVPKLLATPARVRFLSMEPLLGPVCLTELQAPGELRVWVDALRGEAASMGGTGPLHKVARLDWVIVGGESGPGARPMHPGWARSLRDQCAAAGVPFLFKQWGEWSPGNVYEAVSSRQAVRIERSGQVHPYPPIFDPASGDWCMHRVGKKAAGRLLDGREHNAFPAEIQ